MEKVAMSGKTSSESKRKWNAKAYDLIQINVQKGQKDIIKAAATAQNKSLNAFIVEAIKEKIERESNNGKSPMP